MRLPCAGKALAVFSFAEEADLFLRLETREAAGLRIQEIIYEELIWLLSDPRLDIEQVALDPLGRNEAFLRLVILGRGDFLRLLSRR